MRIRPRRALLAAAALAALAAANGSPRAQAGFAAQIERLSEPGGSFDTDNLISNETGYLDVVPAIVAKGATGGAYIGVGPDQNFSYIVRARPSVAFIIDIRRDNLLLHLLFKALFAETKTRAEYLSLLTGRAPPAADARMGTDAALKTIVAYVDAHAATPEHVRAARRRVDARVAMFGMPLSKPDYETIARFHQAFIEAGLGLQFHSFGRAPQPYYPTLRDLLLATDARGHAWNYLASEDDFQFLRGLEERDGVIPVVGDLAGPHAMRAIAADIAQRGEHVSVFYVSNVENYLFRDGSFQRYQENITRLPRNSKSLVIRSIFSGAGQSVSRTQPLEQMVADIARGSYRSYADLMRAADR